MGFFHDAGKAHYCIALQSSTTRQATPAQNQRMSFIWPIEMLRPLIPAVFSGQASEMNPLLKAGGRLWRVRNGGVRITGDALCRLTGLLQTPFDLVL